MFPSRGRVVRIKRADYGDDWERTAEEVLERDNYTCRDCGKPVRRTSLRAVHHIIPLSRGGTNRKNNLKTQCDDCHAKKHPHLQKQPKRVERFKTPTKASVKRFYTKKSYRM
jgi:5-methylcytosine-specific restriction endonuclease McrA